MPYSLVEMGVHTALMPQPGICVRSHNLKLVQSDPDLTPTIILKATLFRNAHLVRLPLYEGDYTLLKGLWFPSRLEDCHGDCILIMQSQNANVTAN